MKNSLSLAALSRVVSNVCVVLAAFFSICLYNLYVSKEIYGTILVGLQIIGYLPLMSGGFRTVLNQRMLAQPDAETVRAVARFGQTLQSYFFVFVVVAGVSVMLAYSQTPKTHVLGIPLLVFAATGLAGAVNFQAGGQLGLLVAFGEQVTSALIQGAWAIMGVVILWASFELGFGVWAFPLSNGLGALLTIIGVRMALAVTGNDVPLFVWQRENDFRERFKAVWRPAVDCLYSQIGVVLIYTTDVVLVGILIGPGAAAVYGIVARVMANSRQLIQSLSEAAWPRLAQELDDARRAQLMKKVDRINAWLVGCWYGAVAMTLQPFLGWLVKSDWVATQLLITLLVVRNGIASLVSPHAYGLMSAGRFKELSRINGQEVLVSVGGGAILSCTALGMYGTACAFLLGTVSISGWKYSREYFRFARDSHWFSEWVAVSWRGLLGGGVSAVLAGVVWEVEQRDFAAPGWMAVLAGMVGFGLPASAILARWVLAKKIL